MAIIRCPECGREISDRAPVCPHCGVVINSQAGNPASRATGSSVRQTAGRQEQTTAGQSSQKKHPYRWLIILGVVAAVAVLGIYAYLHVMQQRMENDKYEQALTTTNTSVIQNYLDLHPDLDGSKRRQLEDRMTALRLVDNEWYDAIDSESRAALIKFIRMHPDDFRVNEANLKVDSIDWQSAKRQNTEQSYQTYIDHHADGVYYDDALRCLQNIQNEIKEPEKSDEDKIIEELISETDSTTRH